MKSRAALVLVLFLLPMSLATAQAKELLIKADEVTGIRPSHESTDLRLLMKFTLPEELGGKSVDFACVSLDVSCAGEKGVVSVEAFRVTTDWDASSVSWCGPWTSDGGDWDSDMSADWVVAEGEGKTVYLDITDFVNGWLREPSKNSGIIVKVSGPFAGTFELNPIRTPNLRILYQERHF
jgi:hypothetical protein